MTPSDTPTLATAKALLEATTPQDAKEILGCDDLGYPGEHYEYDFLLPKAANVIRTLLDVVQKQHEALKDVIDSVAITESMGEICQKDDFRDVRAALALGQPWIETQGEVE